MFELGGYEIPILFAVIDWIIVWFMGGVIAAGAIAVFWDEISEWATRIFEIILAGLNAAIEVASKAMVYLVKRGTRTYKQVRSYIRNTMNGSTKLHTKEEEVYSIPDEIEQELNRKGEILAVKQA